MKKEIEEDLLTPVEGYYDEGHYVNFGWVGSLSTVLLSLGGISLLGGAIFLMRAFDDYETGAEVIVGGLLTSGLALLFMGALLKVVIQIERNTRL